MRLGLMLSVIHSNTGSRGNKTTVSKLWLCFETPPELPESHLVASYTLCELKNHLRPKRAALYGVDLINSAKSQPTTPVNQRQPAGTKYRPLLGSEKRTEIEAVCPLYQNLTFFPAPPFGQVLPSTAAPCNSCLIGFGASVLADQCLIHTASPPPC